MNTTLRRNYPWLVAFVVVLLALTLLLGETRVIAYTVKGSATPHTTDGQTDGKNITNTVNLFDSTVVHAIQILISDADYQQMITTYRTTGAKDWFQADVVIDGVRINQVGLRLKGNASLKTALGRGLAGQGGQLGQPPMGGGFAPGGQPPEGAPPQFNFRQPGGQRQPPVEQPPVDPRNLKVPNEKFAETSLAVDVKVPMLVKFDQFVAGQRYQGFSALAIRSYGAGQDAAMLNEPITNDVFKLMGQVAPRTAFAGVRLNDQAERMYTLAEQINGTYLETYFPDSEGVLYKAEMGADFRYLGEDPSAYTRFYDQKTLVNEADLAPLIAFTKFVSQSSDAEFESQLAEHLNVDAFAMYLAVNNMLVNVDSLADMGNNFYLYYNPETKIMDLLYWDGNESLGKLGNRSGGTAAQYNLYYETLSAMGARNKNNVLKQRFLANPTFRKLYEDKLREVYQKAFASGWITNRIETYAALINKVNPQRNLVNQTAYDQAVQKTLAFIQQRGAYVASSGLLKK